MTPNKPAAPNAGIASRLTIGHHRPGVGEPGRSTMKTTLVFLLALLMLQVRVFAGVDNEIAETNRVVLSSGSWKPSADETQKALAAIQSFLEGTTSTNDWTKGEIKKIREHAKEYRVQFVGVVRQGRKVIWCNFFPVPRNGETDSFQDWKRQAIIVDDGGFWYWQIEYDLSAGKCLKFMSNGYA